VLLSKSKEAWHGEASLKGVVVGEIVAFDDGGHGRVSAIDSEMVEIMVFERAGIMIGTKVVRTGQSLHITVGEDLLGHTIDSFGHSFYDKRPNNPDQTGEYPSRAISSGITSRKAIKDQLMTGILSVDLTSHCCGPKRTSYR
jgi:F0F1-type ATP synthase alpha subunit